MTIIHLSLPIVCALTGLAVFLFIIGIGGREKHTTLGKGSEDEWLYTNGFQKMYRAIFGDEDPIKISKSFGLEYDKYMLDCKILNRTPDFEKEAMMRVIGVFAFIFSLLLSLTLMSVVPAVVGSLMYMAFAVGIPKKIHQDAIAKKNMINRDLSRFVDLFLSALESNFPVETAIQLTADNLPGLLSEELKQGMAAVKLGAKNWPQALEEIAQKYEVEALSDFVVNITTANKKGVSVTEAVARESYNIKQSAILKAKEETAKMSNTILAPVTIFKMVPLIMVMGIPILMQIMDFMS